MIRRWILLVACSLFALCVAACEPRSPETQEEGSGSAAGTPSTAEQADTVATAAEMARAIQANPGETEEILRDHNLTIDQFESLMYDIAADPNLSAQFEAAME